jgi:hypothetical protein
MECIDMSDEPNSCRRTACGAGVSPAQAAGTAAPQPSVQRPPGTCVPWDEKRKEFPPLSGDENLVKRTWEDVDALGYMYIWQVLLSF